MLTCLVLLPPLLCPSGPDCQPSEDDRIVLYALLLLTTFKSFLVFACAFSFSQFSFCFRASFTPNLFTPTSLISIPNELSAEDPSTGVEIDEHEQTALGPRTATPSR